ncbi:hypothetical protein BGX21_009545 [Mortierella sp. AD011]|nr:hypothetical protein BGX21_009545 [Mortierella sp. AD011]
METGDPCFKFSVETKGELEKLLEIPMEIAHRDGIVEQVMMFTRVDNSHRVSELERTVEVYRLHPRTAKSRIRAALNKFGSLEQGKIATRPCTKGCKIAAKVIFRNVDDVKKILESGRKHVFMGTQLARLSKIGNERVEWERRFVVKLSGLPWNMSELDLVSLLEECKANFVDVPYIFYHGKGRRSANGKLLFISNQKIGLQQ